MSIVGAVSIDPVFQHKPVRSEDGRSEILQLRCVVVGSARDAPTSTSN